MNILQDLLIGYDSSFYQTSKKGVLVSHPKFYYFDVGLYRIIRPMGQCDAPQEIGGISVETLVCQQLVAVNDLMKLNYKIYYYRTATGAKVDFIMYGARGIIAIEIKSSDTYKPEMIQGWNDLHWITRKELYPILCRKEKFYIGNITVLLSPTLFIISLFCLIIPLRGEPFGNQCFQCPILQSQLPNAPISKYLDIHFFGH